MSPLLRIMPLLYLAACSASPNISVGTERDGSVAGSGGTSGASGGGGIGGFAGGTGNALTAKITEPPSEMAIEVITVGCAGECKQVLAVATGGNAPYTFAWSDGVAGDAREICADDDTTFSVTVTDTAFIDDEFNYTAQQVAASVTARVLSCPSDGGVDAGDDAGLARETTVPGIASLWLAGQPVGVRIAHVEGGADVVPTNSPIEVSVQGGITLSFTATGSTSNTPLPCAGTPDGGCHFGLATFVVETNGLAGLSAPMNALIGVFLGPSLPTGVVPPTLDAANTASMESLSPLLAQPFFIGDGLTGNGSGQVQRFHVPSGATRLFLGSHDALGGNYNNSGSFMVSMRVQP